MHSVCAAVCSQGSTDGPPLCSALLPSSHGFGRRSVRAETCNPGRYITWCWTQSQGTYLYAAQLHGLEGGRHQAWRVVVWRRVEDLELWRVACPGATKAQARGSRTKLQLMCCAVQALVDTQCSWKSTDNSSSRCGCCSAPAVGCQLHTTVPGVVGPTHLAFWQRRRCPGVCHEVLLP